jgi:uncharacterized protein YhaN
MYNPNSNLDLISQQLKQMVSMVDQMKTEESKNIVLDNYLTDHERRIPALESQDKDKSQRMDYMELKAQQFEYLIDRREELELRQNLYSLDGDANCNS